MTKKQMTTLSNIIKDYNSIETVNDLNKRGLTLADYNELETIINNLKYQDFHNSEFIQLSIKNYLSKFKGLKIYETKGTYNIYLD